MGASPADEKRLHPSLSSSRAREEEESNASEQAVPNGTQDGGGSSFSLPYHVGIYLVVGEGGKEPTLHHRGIREYQSPTVAAVRLQSKQRSVFFCSSRWLRTGRRDVVEGGSWSPRHTYPPPASPLHRFAEASRCLPAHSGRIWGPPVRAGSLPPHRAGLRVSRDPF